LEEKKKEETERRSFWLKRRKGSAKGKVPKKKDLLGKTLLGETDDGWA